MKRERKKGGAGPGPVVAEELAQRLRAGFEEVLQRELGLQAQPGRAAAFMEALRLLASVAGPELDISVSCTAKRAAALPEVGAAFACIYPPKEDRPYWHVLEGRDVRCDGVSASLYADYREATAAEIAERQARGATAEAPAAPVAERGEVLQ